MTRLLGFPNPVDDVSARLVAGGVVGMSTTYLLVGNRFLLAVLAYGFVARVLTGPRLSPLGRLVTQVVRPRLAVAPRLVPGPPKRFAQAVGAGFTVSALVLALLGATGAAMALIVVLTVFALLEAAAGFCMGCLVFGWSMRAGLVPESVCLECADIRDRLPAP